MAQSDNDRLQAWQVKSVAYWDCTEDLARELDVDLTNYAYPYSKGTNLEKTKVFLGFEAGPAIYGDGELIKLLAKFYGKHLAYNAIAHENSGAAFVAHHRHYISHSDNSPESDMFINLVNSTVLEILKRD